jgi:deoxyribonuclease-4
MSIGEHIKLTDLVKQDTSKCKAFQVFFGSPRSLRIKEMTDEEYTTIRDFVIENEIQLFSHAAYVFNIAKYSSHKKGAKDEYDEALDMLNNAMLHRAINELDNISRCGGIGSVFHVGKHLIKTKKGDTAPNTKPFEDNMYHFIKDVIDNTKKLNSCFILETAAGQGTELLTSIIEIGGFYNRFSNKYKKRVKICIDTCHIFACGADICNNSSNIIADIDKYIGWDNVIIVHMNDSATQVGSRVDRHQNLNKGFITDSGKSPGGLMTFAKHCYDRGLPLVLETPAKTTTARGNDVDILCDWCYK